MERLTRLKELLNFNLPQSKMGKTVGYRLLKDQKEFYLAELIIK